MAADNPHSPTGLTNQRPMLRHRLVPASLASGSLATLTFTRNLTMQKPGVSLTSAHRGPAKSLQLVAVGIMVTLFNNAIAQTPGRGGDDQLCARNESLLSSRTDSSAAQKTLRELEKNKDEFQACFRVAFQSVECKRPNPASIIQCTPKNIAENLEACKRHPCYVRNAAFFKGVEDDLCALPDNKYPCSQPAALSNLEPPKVVAGPSPSAAPAQDATTFKPWHWQLGVGIPLLVIGASMAGAGGSLLVNPPVTDPTGCNVMGLAGPCVVGRGTSGSLLGFGLAFGIVGAVFTVLGIHSAVASKSSAASSPTLVNDPNIAPGPSSPTSIPAAALE